MGQPIDFDGSNVVMRAPEGAENVQDMHVYRTRHSCVSCWAFAPEELSEINQTGRIFLSVLASGQQPPVYVGSESTCREVMVDFGPVWPMAPRPPAPQYHALPIELKGVSDALEYGKGMWRTCTGCHESNEGHATGPYSSVMRCHLGGGCFECGGIGAVWDTTDYEDFGRFLAETASRPATAEDVNKAFDPANEALGGAFMAGFREGWIYAEIDADGDRYQEMAEEYSLAVDIAPQEAWGAQRAKFFAMLPLAAIPEVGATINPSPSPREPENG